MENSIENNEEEEEEEGEEEEKEQEQKQKHIEEKKNPKLSKSETSRFNNNYANKTQKFIEPQKYIYDYKLKKLMETETEHSVIIYDDGSVIE